MLKPLSQGIMSRPVRKKGSCLISKSSHHPPPGGEGVDETHGSRGVDTGNDTYGVALDIL